MLIQSIRATSRYLRETLRVSINDVKTIIFTPLKGINGVQDFGQIWTLLEDTHKKTTRHVLRGRHPYEFVKDLRKDTGATTYNMKRLLITETARVQTLASKSTC